MPALVSAPYCSHLFSQRCNTPVLHLQVILHSAVIMWTLRLGSFHFSDWHLEWAPFITDCAANYGIGRATTQRLLTELEKVFYSGVGLKKFCSWSFQKHIVICIVSNDVDNRLGTYASYAIIVKVLV